MSIKKSPLFPHVQIKRCEHLDGLALLLFDPHTDSVWLDQLQDPPNSDSMNIEFSPDFWNHLSFEWSGIIVDTDELKVVAYGLPNIIEDTPQIRISLMNQLENQMQEYEKRNQASSFAFQESNDGHLIRVYRWKDQWHYGTEKFLDASMRRWISEFDFFHLFLDVLNHHGMTREQFEAMLPVNQATHVFKIHHPACRQITPLQEPRLFYLGTRRAPDWSWFFEGAFERFQIPREPLRRMEQVTNEMQYKLQQPKSWTFPGFWILDLNHDRVVQIYNPDYVAVQALKGNTVEMIVHILDLMIQERDEAFVQFFPEYTALLIDLIQCMEAVDWVVHKHKNDFEEWMRLEARPRMHSEWFQVFRSAYYGKELTGRLYYHAIRRALKMQPEDIQRCNLGESLCGNVKDAFLPFVCSFEACLE